MRKLSLLTTIVATAFAAATALAAERNPLHPSYGILDADKDGSVTAAEFMTYMTKMWDEIQADPNPLHPTYFSPSQFKNADTNNDKKISRDEYLAYVKLCWTSMDRDGAGKVAEAVYSSLNMNPLNPNYQRN